MPGLADWLNVASGGLGGYSQKPNPWQGLGKAAGSFGTAIQDRRQKKAADQQARQAETDTLNSVIGSGPKPPMPPPPPTAAGPYRATRSPIPSDGESPDAQGADTPTQPPAAHFSATAYALNSGESPDAKSRLRQASSALSGYRVRRPIITAPELGDEGYGSHPMGNALFDLANQRKYYGEV